MSSTPYSTESFPPQHPQDLVLRPILPSQINRYAQALMPHEPPTAHDISERQKNRLVQSDLPAGWSVHVHPEGAVHFCHHGKKIVTTTDPREPNNAECLNAAWQAIVERSSARDITSSELYLKVSQNTGEVEYYLVKFQIRTVFWVEEVSPDQFGLVLAEDDEAFTSFLLAEFWVHVEYFAPSQSLDEGAESELLSILKFGELDDSTSPTSTCPYSAEECRRYGAILQGFSREESPDYFQTTGYHVAIVARLWVAIARSRQINHWGTMHAQLDRLQGVDRFFQAQDNPSALLYLGDMICLFGSRAIFKRLTLLWNGRIVYQRHWEAFLEEMRTEWLRTAGLGLSIWITAAVIERSNAPSFPISLASSVSVVSTLLSLALHYRHSKERLGTSAEISAFIVRVENVRHGLRPLSIVYGLPRGLTLQAALLLQYGLFLESSTTHVAISTLSATCVGLLFVAFGGLNVL